MFKVIDLEFSVAKNTNLQKTILKNINFSINRGDFAMIIGGNGAGKSTLFNLISGFLFPDQGNIYLDNKNITNYDKAKRSKLISIVMQDPKISTIENMTILENMALALSRSEKKSLLPFSRKPRKEIFQEKLSLLNMGLENRLDDLVSSLSGGQRQALSLCMALLGDAELLLLDEICAALDPNMSELIMNLAYNIAKKQNLTTLMITHNMDHVLKFADKLLILKEQTVFKQVNKDQLKNINNIDLIKII